MTASNSAAGSSSVDYTIFILNAKASTTSLIESFNVNGIDETTAPMVVKVSPNMTKLILVYEYSNGTIDYAARHVDYNQDSTIALQFENPTAFK